MKNYFYGVIFVLALSTAYAISQTQSSQPQSNPPPAATTTAPDASQSNSTPSYPASTYPNDKPSDKTGTAMKNGTGAEGSTANGLPQSDVNASSAETTNLKSQIEGALQKEPTLSSDTISVNVTDTTVELTGIAATGKEKQTAKRIAQSYAGNRRVVDHITVSGRGVTSQSDQSTPR